MKAKKTYEAPKTEVAIQAITCYLMNGFNSNGVGEPGFGGI